MKCRRLPIYSSLPLIVFGHISMYQAKYYLYQCFPNFFVCSHCKKAKQISQRNSQVNQLILIANCITCDNEKGENLLFLEFTTFWGNITRSLTFPTVISWQHLLNSGLKLANCTYLSILKNPRHTCKSSTVR